MPRSDPRQIYQYSKECKLAAVRLSHVPEVHVKAAVRARGINPFMLPSGGRTCGKGLRGAGCRKPHSRA